LADIFLSYARQDSAKAKLLAHALENFGLTVWWDRRLLAGQQFSSEIEREIDGARSVVVLWSDHAAKSRWVRDEASAGADQGKLCPVQIGGGEVPIGFRQFHTIDMKAWAGDADDPTIHELVAQLQGGETTTPPKESQTSTFEPVLAVLPFENLSSEDEMRFFSDGISDEILTRLMHGSKIKIMGRATTFQYRGDRKGGAAKELACTHLLDGSIRRAGGKVRTTAHLLDIASDQIIWSSRFDDDLNDIFETQDRIAEAIAKALDSEFKRGSDRGIPLDLYDRYLKAKVDTWALETLPVSIEQLRQIAHEAPDFADVWAQLAMWSNYYSYLVPLQEAKHYRAIAKRAIIACDRLEYQGVEPLIAQFRSLPPFGSFCDAAPVVTKLQEASTNGPAGRGVLSMHFADIGMLGESIEHAAVGHELDPNDLLAESLFVMSVYWTGDDERAIELMKDYLSQNPANYHVAMTL
jgi:TolB-like protein